MESSEGKAPNMSRFDNVSTKRRRIAELAKDAPDMAMDLSHHMDLEWFVEAYRRTRKNGALGIDGQSAMTAAPAPCLIKCFFVAKTETASFPA